MDLSVNLTSVGVILTAMLLLSLVELAAPLRARTRWSARHLAPNVAITLLTFVTNMLLNAPLLLALAWCQAHGIGLFNNVDAPVWAAIAGAVLGLDLAWYATHRTLHQTSALWRLHAVHHSDFMVDATTAIRQHPGESLVRYGFLAAFGVALGVGPAAFMVYRVWSALHGLFEHANLKLPRWLDQAICIVFTSPDMHKVHHAQDARFTDTNYGNIFSIWDRLFGTFTPARHGRDVIYGLQGYDNPRLQSAIGLLRQPFLALEPARDDEEALVAAE